MQSSAKYNFNLHYAPPFPLLGLTRAEVEDALAPVRQAFDEFRKVYSVRVAYFKCTRRFFDAIYDSYTYPMVRKKFVCRLLQVL